MIVCKTEKKHSIIRDFAMASLGALGLGSAISAAFLFRDGSLDEVKA